MNRNVLKIIAVLSMLIDHIGLFLLNNNIFCRSIGRLAFPIFAFFISEGMKYTRNRKKYTLNLFIFALITQIPVALLFKWYYLNVLFTFLIAIAFIVLVESYKKEVEGLTILKNILITLGLISLLFISLFGHIFGFIEFGLYGIILVVGFYFSKSWFKILTGSLIILIFAIKTTIDHGFCLYSFYKWIPLLSMSLLIFYNGKKGKLNLKYLFYITYPVNYLVIYLILLI